MGGALDDSVPGQQNFHNVQRNAQIRKNDNDSQPADHSGNRSSQNRQPPFGLQEKVVRNERGEFANEPSIQNQTQNPMHIQTQQSHTKTFKINPQLRKVTIAKDQIKLFNPGQQNKENSVPQINQQAEL